MIVTLPDSIRHFPNVFVGRAENSLRVLRSVRRHRKMSLKERAPYVAEPGLAAGTDAGGLAGGGGRARRAVRSCHLVAGRSLPRPSPLQEPPCSCFVSAGQEESSSSFRAFRQQDLFSCGEKIYIYIIFRLKYPRSLNNLALKLWCHFGLGGYSPKSGSFSFSSSFSLLFPSLPFCFLSFPFQYIVPPLLLFKIPVLTFCYARTWSCVCLCLPGFLFQ